MRIRIIKQPPGSIEGVSLQKYRAGHVYDMTPTLANYLVAEGFAAFDRRAVNDRALIPRSGDRRRIVHSR